MTPISRSLDIALVLLLAALATVLIAWKWKEPYLLGALLVPIILPLVLRLGPREGIMLAGAGALLGPLTEIACVGGGLWKYSETGGLFLIPPWLFSIWACFLPAMILILRGTLGRVPGGRAGDLPLALAGLAGEVVLFIALGRNATLALAASLCILAVALARGPGMETIVLMAAGGVLGPACEALPVARGAWSYIVQDFMGMPAWLPFAYAFFAFLLTKAGLAVSTSALACRKPPSTKAQARDRGEEG
ncbi:MAG: hypothetical protein JW986_00965 [Methanotrichaceae archaeon]|nr:hypothetical protein [Methanotrichaceae archaeon]